LALQRQHTLQGPHGQTRKVTVIEAWPILTPEEAGAVVDKAAGFNAEGKKVVAPTLINPDGDPSKDATGLTLKANGLSPPGLLQRSKTLYQQQHPGSAAAQSQPPQADPKAPPDQRSPAPNPYDLLSRNGVRVSFTPFQVALLKNSGQNAAMFTPGTSGGGFDPNTGSVDAAAQAAAANEVFDLLQNGPDLSNSLSPQMRQLSQRFESPPPKEWGVWAAKPTNAGRYFRLGTVSAEELAWAQRYPKLTPPGDHAAPTARTEFGDLGFGVKATRLPSDKMSALDRYVMGSGQVNSEFSRGKFTESVLPISTLRAVMGSAQALPPGTQLKRSIFVVGAELTGIERLTPGDVIMEPQFSSTGWSETAFDHHVNLNITVGDGVIGSYLGPYSARSKDTPYAAIGAPNEREIILPPGTRYVVTDVRRSYSSIPTLSGGTYPRQVLQVDLLALPNYQLRPELGPPGAGTRSTTSAVTAAPTQLQDFPADTTRLQTVRPLGGSTGATLVRDDAGRLFVMKRGSSAEHLREEARADTIYRAAGARVPPSRLYETDAGPVKLSAYIPNTRTLGQYLRAASPDEARQIKQQIRQHFAIDALLANWDVAGLDLDNILIDGSGQAWRADNGGALRFRAQGALKTEQQFSREVSELGSMRSPSVNAAAASVFNSMPSEEIGPQIDQIVAGKDAILRAAPPELRPVLAERIRYLEQVRGRY
jgi:hypothetical protein